MERSDRANSQTAEQDTLPAVHVARVILKAGQAWLTERDLELCGYDPALGDIVRVEGPAGDTYYELAARMVAHRVDLRSVTGLVWWLQRVRPTTVDVETTDDADGRG
jgi:hypothetical protein